MRDGVKQQYDSLYESKKSVFGDGPLPVVTRIPDYLDPGSVLDIGGGEGRNAIYLAARGYSVCVTDLSTVALDRLRAYATNHDLTITTKASDIVEDGISDFYQCLILTFVLHHLNTDEAITVLHEAKAHTLPGGINLVATFLADGELALRNQRSHRFYPSATELQAVYADWNEREFFVRETTTHARDKNGTRLKNSMGVLLYQKPIED